MEVDHPLLIGLLRLLHRPEGLSFALPFRIDQGEVEEPVHLILSRHSEWPPVGRGQDVLGREHQFPCLPDRLLGKRQVHRHLVSVEVCVVGGANVGMDLDGVPVHQDRLEGLDRQAVQGGGAVEEHRILLDELVQDIPYLRELPGQGAVFHLVVIGERHVLKARQNERLEQLQGHLLGDAALV